MKEDMLELIIDLYSNPKTTEYAWELIRVFGNFLSKLESLEREKTELNIQMFKHNEEAEIEIEKQENFLKPCPFCGNKPELRVYYNKAMVRYEYVFCPFCEVRTAKYDTKKAAGVWNKRYMGT